MYYVLPIYTSVLREMGQPKKAIEAYDKYYKLMGKDNVVLITSVAAAYCDIDDYDMALKLCNKASALQDGKPISGELSSVYQRIHNKGY